MTESFGFCEPGVTSADAQGISLLAEQAAAQGAATLGQKIRAAREAHGLTQADLAVRAKVAQAYLSYLEQDEREPHDCSSYGSANSQKEVRPSGRWRKNLMCLVAGHRLLIFASVPI